MRLINNKLIFNITHIILIILIIENYVKIYDILLLHLNNLILF